MFIRTKQHNLQILNTIFKMAKSDKDNKGKDIRCLFLTTRGFIIASLYDASDTDISEEYSLKDVLDEAKLRYLDHIKLFSILRKKSIDQNDILNNDVFDDGDVVVLKNVQFYEKGIDSRPTLELDTFVLQVDAILGLTLIDLLSR